MSYKMLQRLVNHRMKARNLGALAPLEDGLSFTIRLSRPDDDLSLRRLAALDSQALPEGRLLVAEVAGEIWAAVTIAGDHRVMADPFRRTTAVVAVLRQQANALGRPRLSHLGRSALRAGEPVTFPG
jgi:hypothetical protein